MKWLKDNRCPWDEYTFIAAARNERKDIIEWLIDNNFPSKKISSGKHIYDVKIRRQIEYMELYRYKKIDIEWYKRLANLKLNN